LYFRKKRFKLNMRNYSSRRYVRVIMGNGVFILSNSAFDITLLWYKSLLLRLLALRTAFEALEV